MPVIASRDVVYHAYPATMNDMVERLRFDRRECQKFIDDAELRIQKIRQKLEDDGDHSQTYQVLNEIRHTIVLAKERQLVMGTYLQALTSEIW